MDSSGCWLIDLKICILRARLAEGDFRKSSAKTSLSRSDALSRCGKKNLWTMTSSECSTSKPKTKILPRTIRNLLAFAFHSIPDSSLSVKLTPGARRTHESLGGRDMLQSSMSIDLRQNVP